MSQKLKLLFEAAKLPVFIEYPLWIVAALVAGAVITIVLYYRIIKALIQWGFTR